MDSTMLHHYYYTLILRILTLNDNYNNFFEKNDVYKAG